MMDGPIVTTMIEILLLGAMCVAFITSMRHNDALSMFYSFAFGTLYVGQYFYLHYSSDAFRIVILGEYGYNRDLANYILIYLILIFSTISIASYLANHGTTGLKSRNARSNNTDFEVRRPLALGVFYLFALYLALSFYVAIIGWSGFSETRPNTKGGATLGMFVCMAVAVSALCLWRRPKVDMITVLLFLISTIILVMAGARISVIYLWLTAAFTIIKYRRINISIMALVLAIFASFAVLILGQAFKEFTGLLRFDSYWDSVKFTLGVFYLAQTEAFVSSASTLQYQIDQSKTPVNGGVTIFNFINMLLPHFLKEKYTFTMVSFNVYHYSIIPSAISYFLQSFFYYGALVHCMSVGISVFSFNKMKRKSIVADTEIYMYFLYAVIAVTLVRGPMDLMPFTLIAVGMMMYAIHIVKKLFRLW